MIALPQDFSVFPFEPLTAEEKMTDWGKEYQIALMFAEDFDLYRAITNFKRAVCLAPVDEMKRRLELHYLTALSYFLGKKYVEVIYTLESTPLAQVNKDFPAYNDLLLILYESHTQLGREEHAEHILKLMDGDSSEKVALYRDLRQADLQKLSKKPETETLLAGYYKQAKSVKCAQRLNMALPGAGYWYLGQKQTAFTAFGINALFAGAATAFFLHDNIWAGILTLSLEGGWYFGGIYGAGLSAKEYNERLYSTFAERTGNREKSFPTMRLKYSF